jgi:hypothetical protein
MKKLLLALFLIGCATTETNTTNVSNPREYLCASKCEANLRGSISKTDGSRLCICWLPFNPWETQRRVVEVDILLPPQFAKGPYDK